MASGTFRSLEESCEVTEVRAPEPVMEFVRGEVFRCVHRMSSCDDGVCRHGSAV